nr:MAG TPA: hypothetical protein [Caudoviricetes sp.]
MKENFEFFLIILIGILIILFFKVLALFIRITLIKIFLNL